MVNPPFKLYLTCPIGFESVCKNEINKLGIEVSSVANGGLFLSGEMKDVYRINYSCRTGMVLWLELKKIKAETEDQIYENIFSMDWSGFIPPNSTIFLKCVQKGSRFRNTHFIELKTKDAIVDSIRMKRGNRPDIDAKNPDFHIQIFLDKGQATLYLNTSGKPLNRRGYRVDNVIAPLNESLAAAIIQESSWKIGMSFFDPFCGSGTICIEAGMQAFNIPSGYLRQKWAFQKTPWYSETDWNSMKSKTNEKIIKEKKLEIYGSDIDGFAIHTSKKNAARILPESTLHFKQIAFKDWTPTNSPGILITNPPFGIRMKNHKDIDYLYQSIGDGLKQKCDGITAFILCGNRKLIPQIGLRTKSKKKVRISNLDGRLAEYELYSGSRKSHDP